MLMLARNGTGVIDPPPVVMRTVPVPAAIMSGTTCLTAWIAPR